jgi:alpha-tubulin suppressor-like RCC1 family protein
LNADGQLGDGTTNNSDTPVLVSMPSGVTAKAITGGGAFAHIIGSDGNLYGWGLGSSGQLGVSTSSGMATTPVLVTLAPGCHAARHFGQPAHRLRHRIRRECVRLGLRRGR